MTAPALKGEKYSFLSFSSSSTFWCYIETHFKRPHERLGFIRGKNFPENLGWFNGRQLRILTWLNVAFPFVVPLDFLRALRWIFCVVGSVTSYPAPPSGRKLHTPPSDRGAGSWVILLLSALGHSSDLTQTTSSSRGIPHAVTCHHKRGEGQSPSTPAGRSLSCPASKLPARGPLSRSCAGVSARLLCHPSRLPLSPGHVRLWPQEYLLISILGAHPHSQSAPKNTEPLCCSTKNTLELFAYFLQVNVFEEIEKSEQIVTVQISDFSPSSHPTPHRTLKRKQNVTRGQESPPLRVYLFWLLTQFGPSLDLI